MEKYNKEECLALLRSSADWQYYRASLILNSGLLALGLLFFLVFLLTGKPLREHPDIWSAIALLTLPALIGVLFLLIRRHGSIDLADLMIDLHRRLFLHGIGNVRVDVQRGGR